MCTRSRFAAGLLAALLALTACADSSGEDAVSTETVIAVSEDPTVKPVFDVPSTETPPDELVTEIVREGDGETAEPGDTVVVQYVGKSWSTGEQFDASWDRDQPFSFQLGAGNVIQGWDQGVAGMQVGERRTLIIPPDLGYGAAGAGGVIGPNETLVFVVDLLEVR